MPENSRIVADPTAAASLSASPFAQRPDPPALFARRAWRFDVLAHDHGIAPYLLFLSGLAAVQTTVAAERAPVAMLATTVIGRAAEHGMPPIDRSRMAQDPEFLKTLTSFLEPIGSPRLPAAATKALARAIVDRGRLAANVLAHDIPSTELAEHAFVAAGLQVHFACLAANLDVRRLRPIAAGICPSCGSPPVSSLIVGWPGAEGTRYAACSLCGTLWHVVRITCLSCGSTEGIRYQEVEGGTGMVKAETCDKCHRYVKILNQHKEPALDPVADDVGSVDLDLLMRDGPYRRVGFNPFLMGY